MENRIKYVTISLYAEILLGTILSIGLPIFIMVLAADAPQPTEMPSFVGALIALFLVSMPLVVLPLLAKKELQSFPETGSLFLNYMNTCIPIAFVFFPLAFWQLYMFRKMKKGIAPDEAK